MVIGLALLAALGPATPAQPPAPPPDGLSARVDALFAEWAKPDSPGCALVVGRSGSVVYRRAYGMANLEHDVPLSTSSTLYAAAQGPLFLKMAALLLAAEGKLSLDDDIRKYWPELPDYGAPIRIRHLLDWTSGLRDYTHLLLMTGRPEDDAFTNADAFAVLALQRELNFPPGSDRVFSNSDALLLERALQKASGKPPRELLQERIFDPLGMRNTVYQDARGMIVKRRAAGYVRGPSGGFRFDNPNADWGRLITTADDLALWAENFWKRTVGGDAIAGAMLSPVSLVSGRMVGAERYRGLRVIAQPGEKYGFSSSLLLFPDAKFSVTCLCNVKTADPLRLSRRVADIYLEDQLARDDNAEKISRVAAPSERELASLAGVYQDATGGGIRVVSARGGRLSVGHYGKDALLVPLGGNRFEVLGTPLVVTFVPPVSGGRRQLREAVEGNAPTVYLAVDAYAPTPAQLAQFAGTYYSDELQTAYRLVVRTDQLVVMLPRGTVLPLRPTVQNRFANNLLDIRFTPGKDGRATGFLLSAGRISNLRFAIKP